MFVFWTSLLVPVCLSLQRASRSSFSLEDFEDDEYASEYDAEEYAAAMGGYTVRDLEHQREIGEKKEGAQ